MAEQYDVIIAGCGNNGLTVGCYLAKAGYSVLGIERGERIGGGAMTRERIPGYKHDLYARNLRWLKMSPVYQDLKLDQYGVKFLQGDVLNAHVLEDGRCIVRYVDLDKTCAEIARFNKHDAEMYRRFYYDTVEMRKGIIRSYTRPPQVPYSRIGELAKTAEGQKLAYLQITSAINVIDRYFDDENIRTWMYASASSFGSPPDFPGTGLGVISFQMQLHDHPQVQVEGGASSVTDAMGRIIEEHGGKFLTKQPVKRILVKNGRATGVELMDGRQFEAKMLVVAGLGHRLLLEVVEHAAMGQEFTRNLELLIPEDHAVFGLHMALREAPRYKAADFNPDIQRGLFVHFGFANRQEYAEHADDEHQNRKPRHIGGTTYNMSNWDKTLAPPGHAVAGMLFGTSYRLEGDPDNWDEYKAELGRRIIEKWRRYAPNVTDENIVGYFCQSPADTVRDNPSFWEGSQMHIATLPDQSGAFRPFPGWSNYRTPIQGLYVASASCHPTGGVSGMPGYNAVNEIAKDFDIKVWWNKE